MHLKKIFAMNRERRKGYYRSVVKVGATIVMLGINPLPVLADDEFQESEIVTFDLLENAQYQENSSHSLEELLEDSSEESRVDLYEMILEQKRMLEEERKKVIDILDKQAKVRKEIVAEIQAEEERKKVEEEKRARREAEKRARKKEKARKKAEEKARQKAQRETFAHVAGEEFLLAQILQHECGNNEADQICAGSVVLNRVRTNYKTFRDVNTIVEVLYQPKQYYSGTKKYIEPGENALKVAHGLLSGEIPCYEEKILFQTTTWESWMNGELERVDLPGANQCYAYPLDFEEGCQ